MATERVLSNLNLISFKTESGLQNHIDELQDGDLVFTPDNSLKGTLLDYKWADHLLNDMSWLRADTFSWQSGDVYVAAYKHLLDDLKGIGCNYGWLTAELKGACTTIDRFPEVGTEVYTYSSGATGTLVKAGLTVVSYDKTTDELVLSNGTICICKSYSIPAEHRQTETIDGMTITFYRAEDKHKICLPDQEDKLLALYNATGVAWYYLLNTMNNQFKLPRTKFGFTGLRDEVGGYVKPGVPNLKGKLVCNNLKAADGDFFENGTSSNWYGDNIHTNVNNSVLYDASNVSPVYNDSDTVQPPATQMYLYFYVGCFEKEGLEQTAGIAAEMFNNKADVDLKNIPANYDYVIESQMPTEANGYTWYRKYKSGWVEQGGITSVGNVTFPVEMADTNYTFFRTNGNGRSGTGANELYTSVSSRTTTGFKTLCENAISPVSWYVSGMVA